MSLLDYQTHKGKSYQKQYDGEENMTLNAVPNRTEVCKALGVPHETINFSPTSRRQRDQYIFFNLVTHPMLWDILHNIWTKPINNPTRELAPLLKEAELSRWVLLSRVNENKTRTNLVVIVEAAPYCNIKNIYKPLAGLESFENGNDEI